VQETGDDPATLAPGRTTILEQPGFGFVLDLGCHRRKRIRRLKRGTGRLRTRVDAVVDVARAKFGLTDDIEVVPVVILYRFADEDSALSPPPRMLEDGDA
jgi:hypothetical protein